MIQLDTKSFITLKNTNFFIISEYISHNGACYQCNRVCPDNYEPFSATDSNGNKVTFGNQCELNRYNCEHPNNRK